jgi:hypothetical protein
VFHEGTKEVLVATDRAVSCSVGQPDRFHVWFGSGAVYLHAFLRIVTAEAQDVRKNPFSRISAVASI